MFYPRRPDEGRLHRLLDEAQAAAPTFASPGAVERGEALAGFRRDAYSSLVGPAGDFGRACDGLRRWVAHRGAGLEVVPADAGIGVGETVLVVTRVGPLHVVVPCRVATAIDDEDRFGFSYVTLPGHPECGEEAFVLTVEADRVRFTITALSHPADALTRLGGPVSRMVQRQTNAKYLRAMRDWTAVR